MSFSFVPYDLFAVAAPHVAGVAALVWSHFPYLNATDVRYALEDTAEDIGSKGKDDYFGYGLVNALEAYNYLKETSSSPPTLSPVPTTPPSISNMPSTCGNGYCDILDGSQQETCSSCPSDCLIPQHCNMVGNLADPDGIFFYTDWWGVAFKVRALKDLSFYEITIRANSDLGIRYSNVKVYTKKGGFTAGKGMKQWTLIFDDQVTINGDFTAIIPINDPLRTDEDSDRSFYITFPYGNMILFEDYGQEYGVSSENDDVQIFRGEAQAGDYGSGIFDYVFVNALLSYTYDLEFSRHPTSAPSFLESSTPSLEPSTMPSLQPSADPSIWPSPLPSRDPSLIPSQQPSSVPSTPPSSIPSSQPNKEPSGHPSRVPSNNPSVQPSFLPSKEPSRIPSQQPSSAPYSQPSTRPTNEPTIHPTLAPTSTPSQALSTEPTFGPSERQPNAPSNQPNEISSLQPSRDPSLSPSKAMFTQAPTLSMNPIMESSIQPTVIPSRDLSKAPSSSPIPSAGMPQVPSSRPSIVQAPSIGTRGEPIPSPVVISNSSSIFNSTISSASIMSPASSILLVSITLQMILFLCY